jgi:hypothetical protein
MKINEMNQAQVMRFFELMGREFKVRFLNYNNQAARDILGLITQKLTVLAPIDFDLRPMCLNRIIALPFGPGTPDRSPLNQIMVSIHEVEHMIRMNSMGSVWTWYQNYFSDGSFRATEEASCRTAENEVYYWYTGRMLRLQIESGYCLSKENISLAEKDFEKWVKDLGDRERGSCFCDSSRYAILALKRIGVEPL